MSKTRFCNTRPSIQRVMSTCERGGSYQEQLELIQFHLHSASLFVGRCQDNDKKISGDD